MLKFIGILICFTLSMGTLFSQENSCGCDSVSTEYRNHQGVIQALYLPNIGLKYKRIVSDIMTQYEYTFTCGVNGPIYSGTCITRWDGGSELKWEFKNGILVKADFTNPNGKKYISFKQNSPGVGEKFTDNRRYGQGNIYLETFGPGEFARYTYKKDDVHTVGRSRDGFKSVFEVYHSDTLKASFQRQEGKRKHDYHVKMYWANGELKSKGFIGMLDEDSIDQFGLSFEPLKLGKWKHYDERGGKTVIRHRNKTNPYY